VAGETTFKIRKRLVKLDIQGKKVDFTCSVRLGTVLLKYEESAIDFTYDIKKLLLTVLTLVGPFILT